MSRGYFGSLGHALVTVAVVERFKSGRCRDRGGSRERVQGVHTPPPPHTEMTCGFSNTTGILPKKLCGLLVLK